MKNTSTKDTTIDDVWERMNITMESPLKKQLEEHDLGYDHWDILKELDPKTWMDTRDLTDRINKDDWDLIDVEIMIRKLMAERDLVEMIESNEGNLVRLSEKGYEVYDTLKDYESINFSDTMRPTTSGFSWGGSSSWITPRSESTTWSTQGSL